MGHTGTKINISFSCIENINSTIKYEYGDDSLANADTLISLNSSTIQNGNFATLEHNMFLLDGTYKIAEPNEKPYGFFANVTSDSNCYMTYPAKFTISFKDEPKLEGITLDFGDNKYICECELNIDSKSGTEKIFVSQTTSLYKIPFDNPNDISNISCTFTKTQFPNIHPRLIDVYLSVNYLYTDNQIVSLVFNEEISPITSVLPVNTAEAIIHDDTVDFNVVNINRYFPSTKNNATADIICVINGEEKLLGVFYLDEVESIAQNEIKFKFVSVMKKLESHMVIPDYLYKSSLSEYLNYIFQNNLRYKLSSNVNQNKITAIYFKKNSAREILQQVLFLYGLMVKDYNSAMLYINKLDMTQITNYLHVYDVIDDVKLTKISPINKVIVDTYDYKKQNTLNTRVFTLSYSKIYSGNINDKIYVEFDKPANIFRYRISDKNYGQHKIDNCVKKIIQTEDARGNKYPSWQSTDGTEGDKSWYYNYFRGHAAGHLLYTFTPSSDSIDLTQYYIEIEVAYFIESKSQYTVQLPNVKEVNLLHIDKPRIFSSGNVQDFAENLLNYYKNIDLKIEASYIFDGKTRAGDTVYMYIDRHKAVAATIVKQSVDASSGYIAKITAIANSQSISTSYYYMSSNSNGELYMNDNILI